MQLEYYEQGRFENRKLVWSIDEDSIVIHEGNSLNKAGTYPLDRVIYSFPDEEKICVYGFKSETGIESNLSYMAGVIAKLGDEWIANYDALEPFIKRGGYLIQLSVSNNDIQLRDEAYDYICQKSRIHQMEDLIAETIKSPEQPTEIRKTFEYYRQKFEYFGQRMFVNRKLVWSIDEDNIVIHEGSYLTKAGTYPLDRVIYSFPDEEKICVYGFKSETGIESNLSYMAGVIAKLGDEWIANYDALGAFTKNGGYLIQLSVSNNDIQLRDEAYDYICQKSRIHQMEDLIAEARINLTSNSPEQPIEIRKRCNVCGTVFCYTQEDVSANLRNAFVNLAGSVAQLGGVATGNIGAAIYGKQNAQSRIVDYSRCPNCGSKDLSFYDPDAEKPVEQAASLSASSSADEILKFKNLLDMGVITQEEFDAKKKQLLGL